MVLLPFLLGLLLTYLLYPLILRLKRRGLSTTIAILVLYGWLLLILVALALYLLPPLMKELEELALYLPHYFKELQEMVDFIDGEYRRITLPSPLQQLFDEGLERVEIISIQLVERVTSSLFMFLSRVPFILLVPVISFYVLRDLHGLKAFFFSLIPTQIEDSLTSFLKELDQLILAYFRGQLLLSFSVALMSTVAYIFLQIPFALVMGLFTGMMNVIPYLGPILGILPPLLLLFFQDSSMILWLFISIIGIQQIETALLAPRILSHELGLHPLTILFSLLLGGELFGIPGMIFSIPGASVLKTLYLFFFRKKDKTNSALVSYESARIDKKGRKNE